MTILSRKRVAILTTSIGLCATIGYFAVNGKRQAGERLDPHANVSVTHSAESNEQASAPTGPGVKANIKMSKGTMSQPEVFKEATARREYHGIKVAEDIDMSPDQLERFAKTARSAIIHRIRANNPQMDEILTLTKDKVLRSSADDERIEELQSSEELLRSFSLSLKGKPGSKELYRDDLQLRLLRLEFVQSALDKSTTLDKSIILDDLKSALLANTIEDDYPIHQKKSLAYEKFQLLKLIAKHEPGYASDLKNTLDQSHNPKLYHYIIGQL